jgi:hypothetical protein
MLDAPDQNNDTPSPEQLSAAATSGPQPSTAPGGAPVPAPAPQSTPQGAPQPAPAAQPDPVNAHHSMLGRIASQLLGRGVEYQPGPDGTPQPVEVKEKPGDIFRHMMVGALLGGAAAKGQRSFLGGFTAGGKAGVENAQAQDQQRYARAQQQFKDQQEVARSQREQRGESRADEQLQLEKGKATAQAEMWNKEMLLHERDANLRDLEFNERQNENAQQVERWVQEIGGTDAPIPGNNEAGNGAAMQELYIRDPQKFAAPPGMNRNITHTYDMNGLSYDANKGYVDSKGNAVDLKDRTTWHVSFYPQKTPPVEMTRGDLYKLYPRKLGAMPKGSDPNEKIRLPFEQAIGLATGEHEEGRKDADEAYKRKHDDLRADMDELRSKANNYTRQADEAERQMDFATARDLRQRANDAYDEYDEMKQQANPHSPLRKADSGRNGPSAPLTTEEQGAVDKVLQNPGMVAVKIGNKIGPVPAGELDGFLQKHAGARVVGRPTASRVEASADKERAKVSPDMTVLQSPSGGIQVVDNDAVTTFLKNNPAYKSLGTGTQSQSHTVTQFDQR